MLKILHFCMKNRKVSDPASSKGICRELISASEQRSKIKWTIFLAQLTVGRSTLFQLEIKSLKGLFTGYRQRE